MKTEEEVRKELMEWQRVKTMAQRLDNTGVRQEAYTLGKIKGRILALEWVLSRW